MTAPQTILLEEIEWRAIKEAVTALKEQFGLQDAILFGSKARGDGDENSDLDLLIITNQPLQWRAEKALVELLFEIGIKHGVIFSPLILSCEEWQGGQFTEFPIYQEILRDGVLVT